MVTLRRVLKPISFLILVVVVNWPYHFVDATEVTMGNILFLPRLESQFLQPVSTYFAGWPCKFCVIRKYDDLETMSRFSFSAAVLDGIFWLSIIGSVQFFPFRRLVHSNAKDSNVASIPRTPLKRQIKLADIFIVTVVVSLFFGYLQYLRSRADSDLKLANVIVSQGGGVKLTSMLPKPMIRVLEFAGFRRFLCIRKVNLLRPDDTLVAAVVELPYLQSLTIAGGNYGLQKLDPLVQSSMLSELAIVGRELSPHAIATIGSIETLQSLNLMRTNTTSRGVLALGLQPRLRYLNIVHTDVTLADLPQTLPFAKTLRELHLPHPGTGGTDELLLGNWPELVELACYEYDEHINKSPVAVRLRNMPKLSRIELDSLQRFDLDLEALPKLAEVSHSDFNWAKRTSAAQIVPSFPWIRNLRVVNAPLLSDLSIFSLDTELMEFDQVPALQLGLCVFDRGKSFTTRGKRTGYLTANEITLERRQKWIDDLGRSNGPAKLDLDLVPLQDINLRPLIDNKTIRKLKLGGSGVSNGKLLELVAMEQLEELTLDGLPVDGRTLEQIAKACPRLRLLGCNRPTITRLRLEHIPQLEHIFFRPETPANLTEGSGRVAKKAAYIPLQALRLVDLPALSETFETMLPLQYLHIENAPSLTGLSFGSELPKGGVVNGLRDLSFFAAGGANCTDEVALEVLACNGLRKLTFAYSSVTIETMKKIQGLPELEYLEVTGSLFTDELLSSLKCGKLRTLGLNQTQITNSSVGKICEFKELEELDLGGIALNANDVLVIAKELPKLKKLWLRGAQLSVDAIRQISQIRFLNSLDLSTCQLTDEMLAELRRCSELRELKLNSITIGDSEFERLANGLPQLRFELTDTYVAPRIIDKLLTQNRLTTMNTDKNQRTKMNEGEIDSERFAPDKVSRP